MASKKFKKRVKKTNKHYKNFIEKVIWSDSSDIPNFTLLATSSGVKNYASKLNYDFKDDKGTFHELTEVYGINYKKSGKVDSLSGLAIDESGTSNLGDVYTSVKIKNYKKYLKAYKKRIDEVDEIILQDGIPYLSTRAEAYAWINWLDNLPGAAKGPNSSFISFYSGEDSFYA